MTDKRFRFVPLAFVVLPVNADERCGVVLVRVDAEVRIGHTKDTLGHDVFDASTRHSAGRIPTDEIADG